MPNSNSIFAITDGQVSASSYDGTTWSNNTQAPANETWSFIAGSAGKFLYNRFNASAPYSRVVYSITDNATWVGGILPTTSMNNIVAVADGATRVYVSYDGSIFV